MTKEQEQAIKVLEQYKKECIEEYKVELDDKDNIDQPHAFYLHQQIEAVYTVLNMLKEKDRQIEKKEKSVDRLTDEQEEREKYVHGLEEKALDNIVTTDKENIQLKKQINLMAEYIADISDCPLENCDTDLDCENRCNADIEKECWIKYFEGKVKGEERW